MSVAGQVLNCRLQEKQRNRDSGGEMMERWKVDVEITFNPITIGKDEETSTQALYRVKDVLNRMLEKEVEISHYHILIQPKKCVEFD